MANSSLCLLTERWRAESGDPNGDKRSLILGGAAGERNRSAAR